MSNVIGDLLRHRARLSPDVEAVVSPTVRLNYAEYNTVVNQVAHFLLQNHVKKGDRVAVICKNSHPFPIIYLAAAKIGAITVAVNWRMKKEEIRYILEDSTPEVLFYDSDFDQVLPLLEENLVPSHFRVGDGEDAATFEEYIRDQPKGEPEVDVREEDPALIIYTSGTTGRPKGAVCTHANILAGSIANTTTLDLRYRDRFLFVTPLFHISGMMFMIGSLLRGSTLVVHSQFHPLNIWDLLQAEKITGMMSVPSMLSYMYTAAKSQSKEIPSLRMILCGGSQVPEDLIRGMNELGYDVVQVYGATEYTGAITYWMPEMGLETCGSAGKAVYLTEMKIVDPATGEGLPSGEIGEVVCRGPLMFSGYWNREEETQKVIRNGWYHTQDVGWMDENGLLYVVDRLRDMIITSGEKVFPAQVENVIGQLEEVEESAVVGVEHSVWGELARAYVVLKEGASLSEDEILSHVRSRLADYNLHEVQLVSELPRNSMGKVMKYVLREDANRQKTS
ncbi:class I adenylate-forming enzyme family protein [Paludifilum halophilum]|uniref:Long-chain fatty acid--CoA ligase n=1 Tax=Paludifilum halophilum TaxID=1642702 RepID=A0A235B2F3_9BACL|nr:long-chain-fatty-acid--CoA ligase [Paludifilum halophilum]OYD06486.1 long-chain fatty acid--CoA ligase [Paludifilum halophilum]